MPCVCAVASVMSNSLQSVGLPGSSAHGILQARALEWVAMPSPGDPPDPGIEPTSLMSPALAEGFFTHERHLKSPIKCQALANAFTDVLLFYFIFFKIQVWDFIFSSAKNLGFGISFKMTDYEASIHLFSYY